MILSADITTRQNNGNLVLLESFATSQSGEMLEFSDVYFRIATSDESLLSSSSSDSKVVFGRVLMIWFWDQPKIRYSLGVRI